MTYKYKARLTWPNGESRLFDILSYSDGLYDVYIDFVFRIPLSIIVCVPVGDK